MDKIKKILALNAEIQALTEARDALKWELCAEHVAGDRLVADTGETLAFSTRKTVNPRAVEKLPAFKKLPKAVREQCYVSKLDTKRVAALGIDLSDATKESGVYLTIR
mgnify:FL=1|jgi:hypothetical protein cdivTM_07626